MAYKDSQKQRDAWNLWYRRHKKQARKSIKTRREEIRQWLVEYKQGLRCSRCGEDHPACLQFHHTDPKHKEIAVANAVSNGWGRERIRKEIKKCIVLCANCHCKEHFGV